MDGKWWDEPVRCAKFIERFTAHIPNDLRSFDLKDFSRRDLEGIIQLLHGYYTHFLLDSPPELREALRCSAEDVLRGMAMASSIVDGDDGEIILPDELWEMVREDPVLFRYFADLQDRLMKDSRAERRRRRSHDAAVNDT